MTTVAEIVAIVGSIKTQVGVVGAGVSAIAVDVANVSAKQDAFVAKIAELQALIEQQGGDPALLDAIKADAEEIALGLTAASESLAAADQQLDAITDQPLPVTTPEPGEVITQPSNPPAEPAPPAQIPAEPVIEPEVPLTDEQSKAARGFSIDK